MRRREKLAEEMRAKESRMQDVLAHDVDQETLSVVRATAIALGLPLLVLEGIEGLDVLEGHEHPDAASAAALVLVRRPRQATKMIAPPRLAVARAAEVASQVTALESNQKISGEGGIVRFDLGGPRGRGPVEKPRIIEDGMPGTRLHRRDSSPEDTTVDPEISVRKE
jgi:hypothetical protein